MWSFSRNLHRARDVDSHTFDDNSNDGVDPVLANYSTPEIIRILNIIDKIQNETQDRRNTNLDLNAEDAKTLRYLVDAYVK